MFLQVRTGGGIDMHDRADLRIHELLNQARVEVAWVNRDEANFVAGSGRGEAGARDEKAERS
jgi:hypothetical protein